MPVEPGPDPRQQPNRENDWSGNQSGTASEYNPNPAECDIPPEAGPERLEQQGEAVRIRTAAQRGAVCATTVLLSAASGRRSYQCCLHRCPCRIDFSIAAGLLIAFSGDATSMGFFRARGIVTATPDLLHWIDNRLEGEMTRVAVAGTNSPVAIPP